MKRRLNYISSNLKRIRLERGLTQVELAEKTGIPFQHISRWESGVEPNARNLPQIAEALGTDISELLKPHEIPPVKPSGGQLELGFWTEEKMRECISSVLAEDPRLRLIDRQIEELNRKIDLLQAASRKPEE